MNNHRATSDTIRVTMSERGPLVLVEADWPIVAYAYGDNGRDIIVRRSRIDGRWIVYGMADTDTFRARAGWLLPADALPEDISRHIRRVVGVIQCDYALGDDAIARMPAEYA